MITILGFIAACLTTGAYIPQVVKTWKTKATEHISLGMYIMMTTGIVLWLIYGVVNQDTPIIFANAVALILTFIILFFKVQELYRSAKARKWSINNK